MLASALWHMEPTIDRAIKAVHGGTFEAIDYGPFSYHGAWRREPARSTPKLVAARDVIKLVQEKEKEIQDGMFRVNVNDAEPKSSSERAAQSRASGIETS